MQGQYLVTTKDNPPFRTHWFDPENHFNSELEMVVYDLVNGVYMFDGETWNLIEEDHL